MGMDGERGCDSALKCPSRKGIQGPVVGELMTGADLALALKPYIPMRRLPEQVKLAWQPSHILTSVITTYILKTVL